MAKLDTASYKGVRDFYPKDQAIQNYIFATWRKVLESFGYAEIGASILEPSGLYQAKSGEEIAKETYTFMDKGEREVTLRPEMTPTVSRMVAQKRRELGFPLRWYSIPNLFRYEAPQRGRLREHWQLNADIFGLPGVEAEVELIEIASRVMRAFGAKTDEFLIKLNSRKLVKAVYSLFDLEADGAQKISRLIDKKNKISEEDFKKSLEQILKEKTGKFIDLFDSPEKIFEKLGQDSPEVREILAVSKELERLGITNVAFDQTLMRGFDYYTGIVFEVFDTNRDNPRSILGGGRYDDLLELFGEESVPAVGFGAGDVTTRDFLETHGLLPPGLSTTHLYLASLSKDQSKEIHEIADTLRQSGLNVEVDWSGRKLGDQIKTADKHGIKYLIVVGGDEIKSRLFRVKNLLTGEEVAGKLDEVNRIISAGQ